MTNKRIIFTEQDDSSCIPLDLEHSIDLYSDQYPKAGPQKIIIGKDTALFRLSESLLGRGGTTLKIFYYNKENGFRTDIAYWSCVDEQDLGSNTIMTGLSPHLTVTEDLRQKEALYILTNLNMQLSAEIPEPSQMAGYEKTIAALQAAIKYAEANGSRKLHFVRA